MPDNHEKLMNTVNMVLATFGECTVDFCWTKEQTRNELLRIGIFFPEVNILELYKETLSSLTKEHTKTQTELMLRNCESIYAKNLILWHMVEQGLEDMPFSDLQVRTCMFSKAPSRITQLMCCKTIGKRFLRCQKLKFFQNLHKARIVHSENWQKNFDAIMDGENG